MNKEIKTPLQINIEREEKNSADFKLIEEIVGVFYKHTDSSDDATWMDSEQFYEVAKKVKLIVDQARVSGSLPLKSGQSVVCRHCGMATNYPEIVGGNDR
jgi:hypothetical protein